MERTARGTGLPVRVGRPARRRSLWPLLREWGTGYLFILPFVVITGVFVFYNAFYMLYLSFFEYDLFSDPSWVGLKNYADAFRDPCFRRALFNATYYTLGVVPAQTVMALFLAVLLNRKLRTIAVFRTLYYMPCVISSVAASLIFMWLYSKQGFVNYALSWIGLNPNVAWLDNPRTALPAIMLLNIWATSAHFMVVFLAALQDIPETLYEAARIDGATEWQIFRRITVPLLRPAIFLVVVLGVIGCFQVFDQVYVMTRGGPLDSTLTPVYLIYKAAFQDLEVGYAAAMAFILFVIVFTLTVIQRKTIDTDIAY